MLLLYSNLAKNDRVAFKLCSLLININLSRIKNMIRIWIYLTTYLIQTNNASPRVRINDLWFVIRELNLKFHKEIFFKKLKNHES